MTELPSTGTPRSITRWGEPVMHRALRDVTEFDERLETLVADMVATMHAADGVGLAANQVGEDVKVFVFDCPDDDGVRHTGVVCNPVLDVPEGRDRSLDDSDEGCLSLPGAFVACPRPDFARVRGVDHRGGPVEYSGSGFLARCLQHETDHLYGRVFADRLGKRQKKKLYAEAERLADQFPPDWPVTPERVQG
ncbi:MAG: peptide deformylase [Propionibacteriales bacterium]|nr:peptide deformylase [Propionibacteriales bacterium]